LTIAHRLETVADYDLIVVMDLGQVVESGSPYELLQTHGSRFQSLVNELGDEAKNTILEVTKKRFDHSTTALIESEDSSSSV
jgi:ATP-binding cassette subfamily C (CFTR/MRP) protein 4